VANKEQKAVEPGSQEAQAEKESGRKRSVSKAPAPKT